MSVLLADLFLSLDGYALGEGSGPYFGYDGPELQQWIAAEGAEDDRLLMGRRTFELLLKYGGNSDPAMTRTPKLVATRSGVDTSGWDNSSALIGEARATVETLKQGEDLRIRTFGSLSLVRELMDTGLVDGLRLMIFPLLLGPRGREPFFEGLAEAPLLLMSNTTLDGRLVLLEYGKDDNATG